MEVLAMAAGVEVGVEGVRGGHLAGGGVVGVQGPGDGVAGVLG